MHNDDSVAALARVGHTAHQINAGDNSDWILLLGGANHSSCCKNVLLLNIKKGMVYTVDQIDNITDPGFARYEHSSCIYDNKVCKLFLLTIQILTLDF